MHVANGVERSVFARDNWLYLFDFWPFLCFERLFVDSVMQWGEGVVEGGVARLVVEDVRLGWIFVSNICRARVRSIV